MSNKKTYPKLVSPKGTAIWPRLNEPDTKYKPEGEFTCRLEFDADSPEAKAFVAKLEKLRDEAFDEFVKENPKKKKATVAEVCREETDDNGDETGKITFNFKMKHKITRKSDNKVFTKWPAIVNAKRELLKNPPKIGGGSQLKVSFEAVPYFMESAKEFGLTLRMVAVQVINLVEFGSGSRAANDFDDEDGDDIQDGVASEEQDDDADDGDGDASDDGDDGDGDY